MVGSRPQQPGRATAASLRMSTSPLTDIEAYNEIDCRVMAEVLASCETTRRRWAMLMTIPQNVLQTVVSLHGADLPGAGDR
jgi:hypothetical protein